MDSNFDKIAHRNTRKISEETTSGRLNEYLASVDEQAEDMFSRLVKEYADRQGVTEQLKAENQLEWVGKMNNIRSRAVEIIDVELICV